MFPEASESRTIFSILITHQYQISMGAELCILEGGVASLVVDLVRQTFANAVVHGYE